MRLPLVCDLFVCSALAFFSMVATLAQSVPYTLSVSVDEVSVTFHVADFHGTPMDDLTLEDVRVLDNGKRPRQVVSFEVKRSLPVRVGLLVDTSRSVLEEFGRNQAIAGRYVDRLFRGASDRGFVMRFDSDAKVIQSWTNDPVALKQSLGLAAKDHASRMGGTALYDAVYRACRDEFGRTAKVEAGNFILLFSDGSDNASHARMEDVVEMCQSTNTAVYAFSAESGRFLSAGQKVLRELALKTGGKLFSDPSGEHVWTDLQEMDGNLRSEYRIVYKPERLKRDGSFHRLRVESPSRGGVVTARSGYYAPR